MFFLGIAGPLMPYFLVTGILIVFTLEISIEKLHPRGKETIENPHFLIAGESVPSFPEATCHYFDLAELSHQNFAESPGQKKIHFIPPEITDGVKFICLDDLLPVGDYSGLYFGLSPPSSFVS